MQWIRSLLFILQIYLMMAVMAVVFAPWALFSTRGAHYACHSWCRWVIWTARGMIDLKTEVRGTPPEGEVVIAAKHQSFLDIILIYNAVPRGKFIMKRELIFAPILGQFALKIGCVPVDRGKRGAAIAKMLTDVAEGRQEGGQLIIYPEGTRVAPGVKRPYKVGTGALYTQLQQPCIPVATNVGVFWPRRGIYRKPGTAVVEFLTEIAPGLDRESFLARLEHEVETASDRLLEEAGFHEGNN